MAVGKKARAETMQRDNGECQFFCGGQEATEISHFKHQGAGGLPTSHWKNQPPNLAASCGECHNRFPPNGNWRWVEFRGDNDKVGVMKILDPDGNAVPERDLWFYNRWRKLAASMAAQSLQTVGEIDNSVGEMMRDLRDGAEFLQGARTFDEHVSGLGWDPVKANDIADVYEWAVSLAGWPSGVNYAKMELLYNVDWADGRSSVGWVEKAAGGASYSTLKRDLIKAGLMTSIMRCYLLCSPGVLAGGPFGPDIVTPVLVQTRKEEELLESAAERGLAVLKINSFKGKLIHRRGKEGGIFTRDTDKQIPLVSLEEWLEAAGQPIRCAKEGESWRKKATSSSA